MRNASSGPGLPPRRADALLRRILPPGELGLTIIGDLHQEFLELQGSGELRSPHLWYWRATAGLCSRYALDRVKSRVFSARPDQTFRALMMTAFFTDLRFSARMLLKTPLLSLTAIVTIGLGVGLTTQTFSAVYGAFVRGLPVPDEERLMYVDQTRLELGIESQEIVLHNYLDIREQQTSFEALAAFYQGTANLAGDDGLPERFAGAFVTDNALSHLSVPPLMGRVFLPGEDASDAPARVVLGHHVWTNRFSADPNIIGKTVRVNGETAEIIGVMPEGFRFPFNEDLWLPLRMDARTLRRGQGEDLDVFGKLREGVSTEVARAELGLIAADLRQRFPEINDGIGLSLRKYELRYMPEEIRAVFWIMLAATLGVLLIACANVANLLLARATVRAKEVAIRTAMGASRFRVVRQLMVESVLLALLGGGLGVFLSAFGLKLYNDFTASIDRPFWIDPSMETPVLLYSVGVILLASLAAGAFPALRASGINMGEILKDQVRGSSSLRLGRFTTTLVVAEIAVSCALLVGAGMMIQSIRNVSSVDLGFDPSGIMTGRIGLNEGEYPGGDRRDQFFTELKARLDAEPGVVSAALSTHLPALGSFRHYLTVDGESYPTDADHPLAYTSLVSADYFETFGVPMSQGRDFTALETRPGGDPVAIVSQSFAEKYLPGGPALGRRILLGLSDSQQPWVRVVGVVPDMHIGGGVGGLGDDQRSPERLFLPKGLYDERTYAVAVKTTGDPGPMAARLREIVAELDPNLPIYDLQALDDALEHATWAFTLFGVQFSTFGFLALFLAAVGLYGVMAFSVNQRRQEMGVRMALGARNGSIMSMVLGRGATQIGIGAAVGLALGTAAGGPLQEVLYDVQTGDLRVYGIVILTLVATGFLACVLPARAATRADPVEAMRTD